MISTYKKNQRLIVLPFKRLTKRKEKKNLFKMPNSPFGHSHDLLYVFLLLTGMTLVKGLNEMVGNQNLSYAFFSKGEPLDSLVFWMIVLRKALVIL